MDQRVLGLSVSIIISTVLAVGVAVFVAAGPSEGTSNQEGTTQGTTTEAATTTPENAGTTSRETKSTSQENGTTRQETPRGETSREESSAPPETGGDEGDAEGNAEDPSGEAASPQEIEDALQGVPGESGTPSQGSLREGPDGPDLPEDFPAYSQVVDDTSADRFEAPGWRKSGKGKDIHGESYRVRGGSGGAAKYEFEIPATAVYTIFAWWPSIAEADSAARVEIYTGDGTERETVDQTKDGGYWIPVGQYKMTQGDRRAVEISGGESGSEVVADAVAVVRGISDLPENPEKIGNNTGGTAAGGETTFSGTAWGKPIPGRSLMKRGKRHLGTPYKYGGRSVCRNGVSMDCTCFTSRTYNKYRKLPDSPLGQWRYGKKKSRDNLKRGDLVFFDENLNGRWEPWDHAGMYAGNGKVMHASDYFGRVVISEMKYLRGFKGGKRLRYKKLRF